MNIPKVPNMPQNPVNGFSTGLKSKLRMPTLGLRKRSLLDQEAPEDAFQKLR